MSPPRIAVALAAALAAVSLPSAARPTGPALFCAEYPDSASCAGHGITCATCHTSTSPEATDWNSYGFAVLGQLATTFEADLPTILATLEPGDADVDGLSNIEEILLGTLPGDPQSYWVPAPAPSGAPNPGFSPGVYDVAFAAKRIAIAFCGRSPTADETEAVLAAADPVQALHDGLDNCLGSVFWTNEGLSRLADEKIRPIDFGTSFGWDYRMWRYIMSGDRDVRDLLLADYHVREATAGTLSTVAAIVDDGNACANDTECAFDHACSTTCAYRDGRQPLVQAERAGMIGTQWFHFINTMFSAMPRTTTAHAMRSYLGVDIARLQAIAPVANEPLDVDQKGVAQPECAQCHSTLDPATYVFAKYNGIQGGGASLYNPLRPINLGLWTAGSEPQGLLFGQPVSTLREWAQVAAASDEFQFHLARVLFEYSVGRAPGPQDGAEWDALWRSWPAGDVGFTANGLLHRMVDTNAFGAP